MIHHDLSPKPSYTAVKNLIHLFDGESASFAAGMLDFDVTVMPTTVSASTVRSGANDDPVVYDRIEYVRHIVLGTSDGRRFVVLWHDISNSDRSVTPALELTPPPMPATLTVNDSFDHAVIHSFDESGAVTDSTVPTTAPIALSVPDRVMVVELVPSPQSGPGGGGGAGGSGHQGATVSTDAATSGSGGANGQAKANGGCGCRISDGDEPREAALSLAIVAGLVLGRRERARQRKPS